jgi:hypothetical protein
LTLALKNYPSSGFFQLWLIVALGGQPIHPRPTEYDRLSGIEIGVVAGPGFHRSRL